MASRSRSIAQTFSVPALLNLLLCVGLVSALLGDGAWDVLSWAALATPLVAAAYSLRRRL
jgi:hypothetical protein